MENPERKKNYEEEGCKEGKNALSKRKKKDLPEHNRYKTFS